MSSLRLNFTTVLARLLSKRLLRQQFFDDPEKFLSQFTLTTEDKDALFLLDRRAVEQQAISLIRKRFFEVNQMIPQTIGNQRENFREVFFQFAESYWPTGSNRHVKDAAKFCLFLLKQHSIQVNSFETSWLNFIVSSSKFKVGICPDFYDGGYLHSGIYVMFRYSSGECRYRVFHWNRKAVKFNNDSQHDA